MRHLSKHLFAPENRVYLRGGLALLVLLIGMWLASVNSSLMRRYAELQSGTLLDRNGAVLTLGPNAKQEYSQYSDAVPERVRSLMIQKEDRFFYVHPGLNPVSTLRAVARFITGHTPGGSSTITQQLAKNLIGTEQDRSFLNKCRELFDAIVLELFHSKATLLTMYANTVYMGNRIQGLTTASEAYFAEPVEYLNDTQLLLLLATLSNPAAQNPWSDTRHRPAQALARELKVPYVADQATTTPRQTTYVPLSNFELTSMGATCGGSCATTLDADLTNHLRSVLQTHVLRDWDAGVRSGAIVVIKLPENELLSIVGTPDTTSTASGQQINMALQPRSIGSTAKPFIYLEGFTQGLRPYTLVDDREYKFPIQTGFSLYPKNYDGLYHGWITLHTALSNSFNVPSVKTLQYVGLPLFYDFLLNTLGFAPLQDISSYEYGIALGALEMDPLTLAHYLTLFPQEGVLKPLRLYKEGARPYITTPMTKLLTEKKVADPAHTQLVTRILNDRLTGVEQFGLESSLNLSQSNYAVKTGTSQNYHDSWTVGFTPDFLVVVWLGNPENKALKQITGQSGAGSVWHDVMEYLMNTAYNKKTPLAFDRTRTIPIDGSIDFGLPGDVVSEHRNLLPDNDLITAPQDGDTFLQEQATAIPLISPENVTWYVNGAYLDHGVRTVFSPREIGNYTIRAIDAAGTAATITLHIIARP